MFATHFKQLYGRVPICDTSIPELLRQRPVAADLDHPPTHAETHCALSRLRDTGPGDSGLPARFWKALGSTEESFVMVHQLMLDFWDTELMPAEWETGLLKILAKKGDKSDPGNYRGIMLLEVAYKVMANILHLRLQPVLESPTHVDHESQCGFRTKRGTCDASSSIKTLVKKRREHGLDTWILFIDLVKAFDGPCARRSILFQLLVKMRHHDVVVAILRVLRRIRVDNLFRPHQRTLYTAKGAELGPGRVVLQH